jgi:hypothetical protein
MSFYDDVSEPELDEVAALEVEIVKAECELAVLKIRLARAQAQARGRRVPEAPLGRMCGAERGS